MIAEFTQSVFVPKGIDVPSLNEHKQWEFRPNPKIKVGSSMMTGGDIFGSCHENNLFDAHIIMVPPNAQGRVTYIAPEGMYDIRQKLLELEFENKKTEYSLSHKWPVRHARPSAEKLAGNVPLLTGQRVLDALFPSCLGKAN